jgi:hypothetical protein
MFLSNCVFEQALIWLRAVTPSSRLHPSRVSSSYSSALFSSVPPPVSFFCFICFRSRVGQSQAAVVTPRETLNSNNQTSLQITDQQEQRQTKRAREKKVQFPLLVPLFVLVVCFCFSFHLGGNDARRGKLSAAPEIPVLTPGHSSDSAVRSTQTAVCVCVCVCPYNFRSSCAVLICSVEREREREREIRRFKLHLAHFLSETHQVCPEPPSSY